MCVMSCWAMQHQLFELTAAAGAGSGQRSARCQAQPAPPFKWTPPACLHVDRPVQRGGGKHGQQAQHELDLLHLPLAEAAAAACTHARQQHTREATARSSEGRRGAAQALTCSPCRCVKRRPPPAGGQARQPAQCTMWSVASRVWFTHQAVAAALNRPGSPANLPHFSPTRRPPATRTSAAAFSHCRLCVRRPMPPPTPPVPPIAAAAAELPLRPSPKPPCRLPLPFTPVGRLLSSAPLLVCDSSSGSEPSVAAACLGARQAAQTTLNTREMGLQGGAGVGSCGVGLRRWHGSITHSAAQCKLPANGAPVCRHTCTLASQWALPRA